MARKRVARGRGNQGDWTEPQGRLGKSSMPMAKQLEILEHNKEVDALRKAKKARKKT